MKINKRNLWTALFSSFLTFLFYFGFEFIKILKEHPSYLETLKDIGRSPTILFIGVTFIVSFLIVKNLKNGDTVNLPANESK